MTDRKLDRLYRRFRERDDVAALGHLFDLAAPELLRVARHLCRDAERAEDAVAATFRTAIEKRARFDPARRVMPWLLGVLAHHLRASGRAAARTPDPHRLAERAPADAADPVEHAAASELRAAVERGVAELPPTYAAVVRPYLADGRAPAEIAASLGLSPGATHVRLHRGLKRLRAALPGGFALGGLGGLGAMILGGGRGLAGTTLSGGRGLAAVRAELMRSATRSVGASDAGVASAVKIASATSGGLFPAGALGVAGIAALAVLAVALTASRLLAPAAGEDVALAHLDVAEAPAELRAPARAALEGGAEPTAPELRPAGPAATSTEATRSAADPGAVVTRFHARVVDHRTSRPLATATVSMLRSADAPLHGPLDGPRTELARTDARGEVRFTAPAEVEARLVVEAPGYAPWVAPRSTAAREYAWRDACRTADPEHATVFLGELRLEPGARLSGRVRDERGKPVSGAVLLLADLVWGTPAAVVERAVGESGSGGRFTLDARVPWRAPGRELVLFACTDDAVGWTVVSAPPEVDAIAAVEITLAPSARLDVEVEVDGRAPLPGVRLRLLPAGGAWPGLGIDPFAAGVAHPLPEPLARRWSAVTDARGRARFEGVPVVATDAATRARTLASADADALARVDLSKASSLGFVTLEAERDGFDVRGATVPLRPRERAQVELEATPRAERTVRGRVVDASGRPVAGADVDVRRAGGAFEHEVARTDAEGRFVLARVPERAFPLDVRTDTAALPPAMTTVALPRPAAGGRSVDPRDRAPLDVELVLAAPCLLAGRVVDERGRAVEGARVRAVRGDLHLGGLHVYADGRFAWPNADAGAWTLSVEPPRAGSWRETARVEVEALPRPGAERAPVELRLERR